MNGDHLLIELGTEELPPKALKNLSAAFSAEVLKGLVECDLVSANQSAQSTSFATPRRLAIVVENVKSSQPQQQTQRRGPAVQAAFDQEGNPTPAATGFAKSCAVTVEELERLTTDKGEWLSFTLIEAGKSIDQLITSVIERAVKRLPIPKRMRWGEGEAEFVRPVHWLIVMYGSRRIDTQILGVQSGSVSRGHRFHSTRTLNITSASSYASTLKEQGHVIADFDQRQAMIKEQITVLAASIDAHLEPDQDLMDEVTGLVEKPMALLGEFDQRFLQVPAECLISAMRDHQKYFHLIDATGQLKANFITISNIDSSDPQRVIDGNQRVLRARLSDAQFFWDTDRKQSLESWLPKLDSVLFHVKLGSVGQKTSRVEALTAELAKQTGAKITSAVRGAKLAKADLVTNMVGEFDKLQGVMGRYYANLDGEESLVGDCIEQHYWPRFAGDHLPESHEAQVVAMADRLDSLVGIYAAGEIPTGDKDPYSLRRAALAILRILIEKKIDLGLSELVAKAAFQYAEQGFSVSTGTQAEIVNFIRGRLPAYYQNQDIDANAINAVIACSPDKPLDFDQRLQAVKEFGELDEAQDLSAANKRISNILKKHSDTPPSKVNEQLLKETAEIALYEKLEEITPAVTKLFDQGDYASGLRQLAALRSPVDNFFENVMVMSEDSSEQANRLALLKRIQQLFLRVADIAQLQTN
jgi:glycyl-tRNA synthetase beta chain